MTQQQDVVRRIACLLMAPQHRVSVAESCTGGLIAAAMTDIEGASSWFEQGLVTYSAQAKSAWLGIPYAFLREHGAASEPVAIAMARGVMQAAHSEWSIAVSGIAGPGGGSARTPVGTVYFAWGGPNGIHSESKHFEGGRSVVRQHATLHALQGLLARLDPTGSPSLHAGPL